MIKFLAKGKNGLSLGLGITARNVENLKKGMPMAIDVKALTDQKIEEVVIIYGHDEMTLYRTFKEAGLVVDQTQIRVGG